MPADGQVEDNPSFPLKIGKSYFLSTLGAMAVFALGMTLFLLASVLDRSSGQPSPSAFTAPAGFPTSLFSSYYISPAPSKEVSLGGRGRQVD